MSKNILFICEGETEVCLVYKVLKKEFNLIPDKNVEEKGNFILKNFSKMINDFFIKDTDKIKVYNLKGEDKLNDYIDELSYSREVQDINKIIFLMDADYKKGLESGYERTKKAIDKVKEQLLKENNALEITEFIFPNNKEEGMSETLILNSIKCQNIVTYIRDEVIEKIKAMEESNIKNETKSTFMMVAATQNPLRGYAHHFITDCYKKIDVTNKEFLKFIKFLKIELEIDD